MPLALYGHPFSSYTQKVLIALYENAIPHDFLSLDPGAPGQPDHAAEWLRRWPLAKFPLLVDDGRTVVETSIIIECLHLTHPGPAPLLPADALAANDTDPDTDALTVTGLSKPANGTLVLNANGTVNYTPKKGFTGTDSFTYKASDGLAQSTAATVTITVK